MNAAGRVGPRPRRHPCGLGLLRTLRTGSPHGSGPHGDEGSAVVEFLGITLLLLVPLVYLVLTLGRLQAAAFATDGAAREAVRAVTSAAGTTSEGTPGPAPAGARAVAAVGIALSDQGIRTDPAQALELSCGTDCSTPGSTVTATIRLAVDLPLVPDFLRDAVPLSVPVSASATGTLERFAEARP